MDKKIDKRKIIAELIKLLNEEITVAKKSLEISHNAALDAEGAMMSRYDTTKEESQYLTNANMVRLKQLESGLQAVESMLNKLGDKSSVILGSLVGIRKNNVNSIYFIMPYGGGNIVYLDAHEVYVLTPASPLGRHLIGKKTGDVFEFLLGKKKDVIEIVYVQ